MDIEKNDKIIIFPDFQKLKDCVERLRTEVSMLFAERDELEFVICKNIETLYYIKLGALEHKAFKAQCTALRLKRKIELIQATLNRQEKINENAIETTLDSEFEEFQKKLNEQINKMNEALTLSKADIRTPEETKELKKLYRNIVKNLHPDLNPNVSEAQIRLFENAVTAYKNGDLMALRIIEEMVGNHTLPDCQQDAMSQLLEQKANLESVIAAVNESISLIKSRYPYNVKEIVEDPDKESERREELENILNQYNTIIEFYNNRIKEMLG